MDPLRENADKISRCKGLSASGCLYKRQASGTAWFRYEIWTCRSDDDLRTKIAIRHQCGQTEAWLYIQTKVQMRDVIYKIHLNLWTIKFNQTWSELIDMQPNVICNFEFACIQTADWTTPATWVSCSFTYTSLNSPIVFLSPPSNTLEHWARSNLTFDLTPQLVKSNLTRFPPNLNCTDLIRNHACLLSDCL